MYVSHIYIYIYIYMYLGGPCLHSLLLLLLRRRLPGVVEPALGTFTRSDFMFKTMICVFSYCMLMLGVFLCYSFDRILFPNKLRSPFRRLDDEFRPTRERFGFQRLAMLADCMLPYK